MRQIRNRSAFHAGHRITPLRRFWDVLFKVPRVLKVDLVQIHLTVWLQIPDVFLNLFSQLNMTTRVEQLQPINLQIIMLKE